MDTTQLKKSLQTDTFKDLRAYLYNELQELKDISNIDLNRNNVSLVAVEVKGRQFAYLKLRDILIDLINIEEEEENNRQLDDYSTIPQ